jgi:hypothetical protein
MALTQKFSTAAVNAKADAQAALLNNGFIDVYDGTQPATPNTAVTTQVRLARLTYGAPAYAAAVEGVATARPITQDPSAAATGTASWSRYRQSDGTAVLDGSVGTSGCNLNLNTVAVVQGAAVSVTAHTLTEPKA